MSEKYKAAPADLTRECSDDPFSFKTTAQLEPLDKVIGQKRAVEAIDFGLNMTSPGYNIFITGLEGTGKSTITLDILTKHAALFDTPQDLCLVNNFDDEYCPKTMEMPTGSAVFFSRRMSHFIDILKVEIPKSFEAKSFQKEQNQIKRDYAQKHKNILGRVNEFANKFCIGIVQTEKGYQAVPVQNGQPILQEAYDALDDAQIAAIETNLEQVKEKLELAMRDIRDQGKNMQDVLVDLAAAKAGTLVSEQMDLLFSDYKKCAPAQQYLDQVRRDIVEHIAMFIQATRAEEGQGTELNQIVDVLEKRYQVNVLVDQRGKKGAPVIFEESPTFQNLFGKIEKKPVQGGVTTDFTMVQAGSLLQANNGYLVMDINPLLRNPFVWETLKNTLINQKLQIQDFPEQAGYSVASLKPQAIPVDVTVILLGSYEPFRALQSADPKFNKIFRVRADFDHEVELTSENLTNYARFIARVCKKENLLHFTPCGVTAVVEYGNRIVADKKKLSLRFGQIFGVLKEADYWAKKADAQLISEEYVRKAIHQYRFRHNLYEEKVQERYDDQSILLSVTGKAAGQVNALAVYQVGDIAFGRPSRITAESYMGKPGIINVEHEAELSGQTHDKGVMIIAGYLGRMFAQDYPLSVSISITFEQSYSGIDGDSASSTELYAVLSSLSGYPIRQGIAVTGSVNQKGEIQAIGGVNEKIEGFYDVCVKKGLTSDQGVMIPSSNVKNLMLRKDVVDAVEKGRFHIYQVAAIEQGIEVLTGIAAGEKNKEHQYPPKSIFGAVQAKLKTFHDRSVKFNRQPG
ncbi:MAG: AAA family ATPase [Desulfobacteraceae bacterium]|nr:AAA family ATPase [Desulfobacteraceae bacterium]